MFAAIGLVWAGYAVASWGFILVRGYNITFLEWVDPLKPYTWPAKGTTVPTVPQGSLLPTTKAGSGTTSGGTGGGTGGSGPVPGSTPGGPGTI